MVKFDTGEKRDKMINYLNYEYTIPDEFKACIKEAIKQYSNSKNFKDETLDKFVNSKQSLKNKIANIPMSSENTGVSQFKGYVAEWLICMEYNTLKNKGNVVLTLINPDDTSKADLLHIIKIKDGYKCVAGPDVKASQDKNYIMKQWSKTVNSKRDIPMIDFFGLITTEEERRKNLSYRQLEEFNKLSDEYPNKKPLSTSISVLDLDRVALDYLRYVDTGELPSKSKSKFDVEKLKNPEYKRMLKNKADILDLKNRSWVDYNDISFIKSDEVERVNKLNDSLLIEDNKSSRHKKEAMKNSKHNNLSYKKHTKKDIHKKDEIDTFIKWAERIYKVAKLGFIASRGAKQGINSTLEYYDEYYEYNKNEIFEEEYENMQNKVDITQKYDSIDGHGINFKNEVSSFKEAGYSPTLSKKERTEIIDQFHSEGRVESFIKHETNIYKWHINDGEATKNNRLNDIEYAKSKLKNNI